MFDSWGFSDKNYSDGEFRQMLESKLADGWRVGDSNKDLAKTESRSNSIHCIIFFVPVHASDNEEYFERLNKFSSLALDRGMVFVLCSFYFLLTLLVAPKSTLSF